MSKRGVRYRNCNGCMYMIRGSGFNDFRTHTNRLCQFISSGHSAIYRSRRIKMDLRGPDHSHCLLKDTRKVKEIPKLSNEEYQAIVDQAIEAWGKEQANEKGDIYL